jgi:cyclopropane-fatty-acyl-phospholipid synthase
MRKYIFPGGYVPALSEVLPIVEELRLWVTDIEILRLHYAETLRAWRRRFERNRDRVKAIYDERFCRMFEFYLISAESMFLTGSQEVFHMQLARKRDAAPIVRDYITDTQRRYREVEPERLKALQGLRGLADRSPASTAAPADDRAAPAVSL